MEFYVDESMYCVTVLHAIALLVGFLELLSQLTTVGDITKADFEKRFDQICDSKGSSQDSYRIFVIEDVEKKRIVGTATLFVELKFIRGCASCGHIEDVVVDSTYRGKQLGKRLVERLREEAVDAGCYKIILDCSEENQPFYEKCGLQRKEVQMVQYL